MPASVLQFNARREGTYVLLEAVLPGRPVIPVGVLLVDPATGRGWFRLRGRYDGLASAEDAEVLEALGEDAEARVAEWGPIAYLESLEDSCSNVLRVSPRETIAV